MPEKKEPELISADAVRRAQEQIEQVLRKPEVDEDLIQELQEINLESDRQTRIDKRLKVMRRVNEEAKAMRDALVEQRQRHQIPELSRPLSPEAEREQAATRQKFSELMKARAAAVAEKTEKLLNAAPSPESNRGEKKASAVVETDPSGSIPNYADPSG